MRLLCLGDSNTYGYDPCSYLGGRYSGENRWVDLLAEKTGWEIINAGENGREIPHRKSEIAYVQQLFLRFQPLDLLLVMLGSNDLLKGVGVAGAVSRMEEFLVQPIFAGMQIILIAPPPMKSGDWVTEKGLLTRSLQLASAYQNLADRLGIRFIDAGKWKIDLTFDGVHFTETGHQTFAKQLYLALIE